MKNILIFILVFIIILLSFYIFYSKNLLFDSDKIIVDNEDWIIDVFSNSWTLGINSWILEEEIELFSLEETLEMDWRFFDNFYNIKDDFNYSELLINEFKKVKNLDDFLAFEDKFWGQLVMFTSLKLGNINIFLKYFNFLIVKDNIIEKTWKSQQNLQEILEEIFFSFFENGSYDKLWYIDDDWEYDYFRLSLMSKTIDEKIDICRSWYNNDDDIRSCTKFNIFMYANESNEYCYKLNKEYYRKWCNDTLRLMKK